MRLFAIIANVDEKGVSSKALMIVDTYLSIMLNKKFVTKYLDLFQEYVKVHHKIKDRTGLKVKKRTSVNSVKVLRICNEINEQLNQEEKIIVLVRLFEFIGEDNVISDEEIDFVKTVADVFNVKNSEYLTIKHFVFSESMGQIEISNLLYINNSKAVPDTDHNKHIRSKNLNGEIQILYIESTNTFVLRYMGDDSLFLNSQNIIPFKIYFFDTGSVLKGSRISQIYQSDVVRTFIQTVDKEKIQMEALGIEYTYPGSNNGIKELNFKAESGDLIGIMGGSGVGKSTLLNILNGNLKPDSGRISINGYDIHNESEQLEGIIGFVPQDDLLIEELTVFQNLYFNTKLCFDHFSNKEIADRVHKVLHDLDLFHAKDLRVGNPLKKTISGGQRKRLNIALELIREPAILIVDEPTSGLSSRDSELLMSLLKEQTLQGKLVLVNIHQPSSDIYKLFDNLLIMDRGGFPVYKGNPVTALTYFKKYANHINVEENECSTCGNVDAELPLQILESKQVDQYGKYTKERKVSPKEWYKHYQTELPDMIVEKDNEYSDLPKNNFKIPERFKQLIIFSKRNILSKLTDKQYLLITFLEAPLLALILGYFSKYISGTDANPDQYIFAENVNLPAFLFMAVTVALFIGLTVSAEEIIKDRRLLKREKFLNLSKFSYLNSKILVLFLISAIQTLSFVIIGNLILEIKGMALIYWLILFTVSAFANILGLNISASLKSVVTIYITIPFILVPQLLFSGVIVDFNKLHKNFTSYNHVPIIGDIMTSRWAYEAICVAQFKNNNYHKYYFENNKTKSTFIYQVSYLIPKLEHLLKSYDKDFSQSDSLRTSRLIYDGLSKLYTDRVEEESFYESLKLGEMNNEIYSEASQFLSDERKLYNSAIHKLKKKNDRIFQSLTEKFGDKEKVYALKKNNHNKQLETIVQNKNEPAAYKITEDEIIRLTDPIYKDPVSRNGRAHFYAPHKNIAGMKIDTILFNILFIWFTTIILYVFLIFGVFERLINLMSKRIG